MADLADQAQELTENTPIERKPEGPEATGFCLNCYKDFGDFIGWGAGGSGPLKRILPENARRWCDADCRDDWEKRNV